MIISKHTSKDKSTHRQLYHAECCLVFCKCVLGLIGTNVQMPRRSNTIHDLYCKCTPRCMQKPKFGLHGSE